MRVLTLGLIVLSAPALAAETGTDAAAAASAFAFASLGGSVAAAVSSIPGITGSGSLAGKPSSFNPGSSMAWPL